MLTMEDRFAAGTLLGIAKKMEYMLKLGRSQKLPLLKLERRSSVNFRRESGCMRKFSAICCPVDCIRAIMWNKRSNKISKNAQTALHMPIQA